MIASSDHFNFCAKYSQLSSIPSRYYFLIFTCHLLNFVFVFCCCLFRFSPERRFKTISPCRRLFEDHPTNQNSSSQYGFVVSNGNLTTPNTSNNNGNNFNFDGNDVISEGCVSSSVSKQLNLDTAILTAVGPTPLSIITTAETARASLNNNCNSASSEELKVFEGLSEILSSSYNRRGSISQQFNPSSPYMDDLGFLSSNTQNSDDSMKNGSEIKSFDSEIMRSSLKSKQDMLLTSSPTSNSMSCFIRKSTSMHWNRRIGEHSAKTKTIQPRRSFSEGPQVHDFPQISDNGLVHHLPCFDSPNDAIKRISPDVLIDVLDGKYSGFYKQIYIVDCRYPYEFEGGHIPTAINVNSPDVIENLLLRENIAGNSLIVFHCEFSSERAPRMALHVRNLDRQLNKTSYPSLFYPEMYILDGGYKNYWQQHSVRCEPPNSYLPMRNPKYRDELRHHQKMKHSFRSGSYLSQHSIVKSHPPKSSRPRSRSLNVANARKFFNDLISSSNTASSSNIREEESDENVSFTSNSNSTCNEKHMFPSYSIPMANSFSSIFASELDMPSEMDLD